MKKSKLFGPWGLVVGVFSDGEDIVPVLAELRRRGLRRSAALTKNAEGQLRRHQNGLTSGFFIALGAALGGTLGTVAAGALFPHLSEGQMDFASLFVVLAFALLGGVSAALIHRAAGGGVPRRLLRPYERWLLRDEAFVIVQSGVRHMRRALDVLQSSARSPAVFVVRPQRSSDRNPAKDILLEDAMTPDRLRVHARALARAHRVSGRATRGKSHLRDLAAASRTLRDARNDLRDAARLEQSLSPAAEWLLDNGYLVEGLVTEVRRNLPRRFYETLPVLEGTHPLEPRVRALALELILHTEAQVSRGVILDFLKSYQEVSPLTIGELWALPLMLRLLLISTVRGFARRVNLREFERERADFWANRLINAARREPRDLLHVLTELGREVPNPPPHFAVRLTSHLHDEAAAMAPAQHWLERKLGLTLAELIQNEKARQANHQLSIARAITSMRALSKLEWKSVFEETCVVESVLCAERAGIHPCMDFNTRDEYHHAVESMARRAEKSEEEVARAAVDLACREASGCEDCRYHVGYYLVGEGRRELEALVGARSDPLRSVVDWVHRHPTVVYVGSLGVLTAAITAAIVLASAWAGLGWIPTLLLSLLSLLPASQLAVQALNYGVTRLLPPVRLPRLSFQNGIPTAFRTLVVVPVIPRSIGEVDGEVGRLEVRYLANADPNLAFGLLSDFADGPQERMPDDERLLAREIEAIEGLNQRHGKDRFFLLHRPRSWSESDQIWMGRERKRGTIEELNRLLCGDTAPELRSMIHVGSPELFVGVRFVI
ncbi:MAG TPA: hypothetical protein VMT52_06365, partial [Planctomycetota bacterium]|nr:hypothetical protein [Planctomycetota bacterium]